MCLSARAVSSVGVRGCGTYLCTATRALTGPHAQHAQSSPGPAPHLWTAISDSDQRPAPASRVQVAPQARLKEKVRAIEVRASASTATACVMNISGDVVSARKNTDDAGAPGHTIIAVSTPSLFPGYSCRGHRPSRGMRHRESRASPHARLESRLEPLEERDVAPALEPLLGTQEPLRLRDEKQVGVEGGGVKSVSQRHPVRLEPARVRLGREHLRTLRRGLQSVSAPSTHGGALLLGTHKGRRRASLMLRLRSTLVNMNHRAAELSTRGEAAHQGKKERPHAATASRSLIVSPFSPLMK